MGRIRRLAAPLLVGALTTLSVFSPPAHADEPVDPTGIGDLMPGPGEAPPEGTGTLYEEYGNPNLWILDEDLGNTDFTDGSATVIYNILMSFIVVIGRAVTTIVGWLYELISLPELSKAVESAISGSAGWVFATFFPAAFAVGAVVVFSKRQEAQGSEMGQWGWLFAAGVLAVSLLTSPGAWVSGVDTVRQLGATVATKITADGMSEEKNFPFKLDHEPSYSGDDETTTMLRKSSDSVWRSYVAGPWCVANFGSIEVCQRHGKDLLDQGADRGERKEWLRENVNDKGEASDGHVGAESVKWRQGKYSGGRVGITAMALVALVIFAAVLILLALSALFALIGAMMLLVMGVIFACLWCIPGRPRDWGKKWFDFLLGYTLQSFIATMILGVVLILNSVITGLMVQYGWLIASGLSIAVAVAALKLRRVMESIMGVSGVLGGGAAVAGFLAMKGAGAIAGRASRIAKNAGGMIPSPPSGSSPTGAPGGGGGGAPGNLPSGRNRPTPPPPPSADPQNAPSTPGDQPPALPAARAPHTPRPPGEERPLGRYPSRPELPPGNPAGGSRSIAPPPAPRTVPSPHRSATHPPDAEGRPGPQLRPENPGQARSGFAFRPAPAPGRSVPRVVRGQVVRRGPARPIPAAHTVPGARTAAGRNRRPAPQPAQRNRGRS